MIKSFVLALLLSAVSPAGAQVVKVWLPTLGQTGTWTAQGLTRAGGDRLPLATALAAPPPTRLPALPDRAPLQGGGQVALLPAAQGGVPDELVTTTATGETIGRLRQTAAFPFRVELLTSAGPCLRAPRTSPVLSCRTPDLAREWARIPGKLQFVSQDGQTAWYTRPATDAEPYRPDIPVTRVDLRTGTVAALNINAETSPEERAHRRAQAEYFGARNDTGVWQELPDGRLLVCVLLTTPKADCRYDVLGTDLKHQTTLEGPYLRQTLRLFTNREGTLAYTLGSSVHVWSLYSGAQLQEFTDPAWFTGNRAPVAAFLTTDDSAVLVITGEGPAAIRTALRADLYPLSRGKKAAATPVQGRP